MNYRTEFPDFPPEDMPNFPIDMTDCSWGNDNCPSFRHRHARVWIDYVDPAKREWPQMERYCLEWFASDQIDAEPVQAFYTNDWAEVDEALRIVFAEADPII